MRREDRSDLDDEVGVRNNSCGRLTHANYHYGEQSIDESSHTVREDNMHDRKGANGML